MFRISGTYHKQILLFSLFFKAMKLNLFQICSMKHSMINFSLRFVSIICSGYQLTRTYRNISSFCITEHGMLIFRHFFCSGETKCKLKFIILCLIEQIWNRLCFIAFKKGWIAEYVYNVFLKLKTKYVIFMQFFDDF